MTNATQLTSRGIYVGILRKRLYATLCALRVFASACIEELERHWFWEILMLSSPLSMGWLIVFLFFFSKLIMPCQVSDVSSPLSSLMAKRYSYNFVGIIVTLLYYLAIFRIFLLSYKLILCLIFNVCSMKEYFFTISIVFCCLRVLVLKLCMCPSLVCTNIPLFQTCETTHLLDKYFIHHWCS